MHFDESGEVESFEPCVAIRETDRALLVRFPDSRELWIPKSQISQDSDLKEEDDEGTLVVSRWIAEQKELI